MQDFSLFITHPWTIISFIVIKWALNFYIKTRQFKKLSVKTPPQNVYEFIQPNPESGESVEAVFMKSQSYGLDSMKFSFVKSVIRLMTSIIEIVFGFLPIVWSYSTYLSLEYFGSSHEIIISIVFVSIFMVYGHIIEIPLNAIDTFFIEAKHGFNKTTVKTFITDIILAGVISP